MVPVRSGSSLVAIGPVFPDAVHERFMNRVVSASIFVVVATAWDQVIGGESS